MVLNKKLVFCIAMLLNIWGSMLYAAEDVDLLASALEKAYKTKASLSLIEDEGEKNKAEIDLRTQFSRIAWQCQNSRFPDEQDLAPLCLIEAALLSKKEWEIPKSGAQASLGDLVDYDFGTMEKFLSIADGGKFRCVFSVDGGGIRGLIPALYFDWIEQELGANAIVNMGDLFAGTSVGGIILAGLNCPKRHPAAVLTKLFKEKGGEIFPRDTGLWSSIMAPLRYIKELFLYSRYDPSKLETLLNEYFDNDWLHQSAKPLLVTSIQTTNNDRAAQEYIFSSVEANKQDKHGENYRFKDITRATSAATTYFPAASISSYDGTPRRFVDGGLTVNNPARYSYLEAKKLFPGERIVVFSFGTGKPKNIDTIPADAGAARSAQALINNMMTINSEQTHFSFADPSFLTSGDGYVRVQCELDENIDLDDVSPVNLAYLEKVAQTQKAEIALITQFLAKNGAK